VGGCRNCAHPLRQLRLTRVTASARSSTWGVLVETSIGCPDDKTATKARSAMQSSDDLAIQNILKTHPDCKTFFKGDEVKIDAWMEWAASAHKFPATV
jgi:hypothetical protein